MNAPTRKCVGAALAMLALAGCTTIGPRTITVDRFDYGSAIAQSWKEQTLLNIVKIRYVDLPVFVDVSSIVAGYSLQTGMFANGVVSSANTVQGDYGSIGGQAVYTERPTITYVPMTGDKFLRALITPIDPKNIFFMLQSGYPADFVLALTVEPLNGLRNRSFSGGVQRDADPEFVRVLQLIREVQLAGGVGMRVEENKENGKENGKDEVAVLFFQRDDLSAELRDKGTEARQLLRLPADQYKFRLTYSPMRGTGDDLAVNSRSLLQILQSFATHVEVPEQHVLDQRTAPALDHVTEGQEGIGRIRSSTEKPKDSFVAVQYKGYWFWVDDGDWRAKRALTAIMYFFTLAEGTAPEKLPLVTIPAQ
jgi:hypothetical protein